MGERYMIFREMLQDERAEGREEGLIEGHRKGLIEGHRQGELDRLRIEVLELLGLLAPVPDSLKEQILSIEDPEILSRLLKKAAKSSSFEGFLAGAGSLLSPEDKH